MNENEDDPLPAVKKPRELNALQKGRIANGYDGPEGLARLSKESGYAVSTLRRFLSGSERPRVYGRALRLARLLGCAMMDVLLNGSGRSSDGDAAEGKGGSVRKRKLAKRTKLSKPKEGR